MKPPPLILTAGVVGYRLTASVVVKKSVRLATSSPPFSSPRTGRTTT